MRFPHNISRIEAFSDAVFAFAATLLVVSLGTDSTDAIIDIDVKLFTGFAVSFFVLVILWFLHYNFFRRTNYMDNVIIAINAVLLFVVLYYVFPLKSLVNSWFLPQGMTPDKLAGLFELYGLGFALIFLCLSLMYYRAYKKSKHLKNSITLLFYVRHFGLFVVVALISIIIAYLQIGINYGLPGILYALLGPFCSVHSYLFYKKFKTD
ncbi:transglutaminase [Maribacter sp. 4U21]|uniref:TMEM175 family protein n=1 Tax=Maribacter sp. 4U21 TaxID=1889779 RepID=UPI000C15CE45|nr:TMEM175 family protein [Maribacter sp. 4U21]PIB30649.1 transglutaminase [Maribacter sp. 4U21]